MNVSPHTIMDALSCESKAYFRHVCGMTTPHDALKAKAGQAIHAGIAAYYEPSAVALSGLAVRERALAVFHSVYDPAYATAPADQLDIAYTPKNLHRILDRWLELNPREGAPWKRVVEVETAFVSREFTVTRLVPSYPSDRAMPSPFPNDLQAPLTIPEDTQVSLIVRPDLLVERFDGLYSFVDVKTTGWRIGDEGWKNSLRLSLQFQLYTDSIIQRFGRERSYLGGWMLAIEIKNLPGGTVTPPKFKKDGTPYAEKKCAEHGKPYAVCGAEHLNALLVDFKTTEARIARHVEDAKIGAGKLVKLHTHPPIASINTFGGATNECRFCPGMSWCLEADRECAPKDWTAFVSSPYVVEEGTR